MTHYYIEFSQEVNTNKKKIRDIFEKKFPYKRFEENNDFSLFVGDFIEGNFRIMEDESTSYFSINSYTNPILDETNLQQASIFQEGYSPLISFNEENKNIKIITDPFGLDYIYVAAIDQKRLVISSHLKYILIANPVLINELNYDAIVEFLFSHTILGKKTFFNNILLLPYNSIIDIKNWELDLTKAINYGLKNKQSWYNFPTSYDNSINLNEQAEKVAEKIKTLIQKIHLNKESKIAFLLSGGLDSRTIISNLPKTIKNRFEAHTVDVSQKGMDITKAKKLAKIIGIPHFYQITNYKDIMKNSYYHLWLNEGLSKHTVSILITLFENIKDEKYIVHGYVGDSNFGGLYHNQIEKIVKKYQNPSTRLFETFQKNEYSFPKKTFYSLFKNNKEKLEHILFDGFNEESNLMWETKNDILELECLLAQTNGRKLILGGPRTAINYGPVILPFFHPEVFREYIIVPPKYRKRRNFEKQTIFQSNKKLAEQSATSLVWYTKFQDTKLVKFGLKVLRFFETIVGKRIVPIYSPLPFFEWLREKGEYYDFIVGIIESQDALIWNILDRGTTLKLFNDFINRKNHLHKVITNIVDLEIILELFVSLKEDNNSDIILISNYSDIKKQLRVNMDLKHLREITTQ